MSDRLGGVPGRKSDERAPSIATDARPRRLPTGRAACAALLIPLLAGLACGDPRRPVPTVDSPGEPLRQRTVESNLLDSVPSRFHASTTLALDFATPTGRRYLDVGWSVFEGLDGESEFVGSGEREAAIRIPLSEPSGLRGSLAIRSDPDSDLGAHPSVRLLWNGAEIAQIGLRGGWQDLAFRVDQRHTRAGMNTLLIQPSFWFTAASHPADTGRSRTRSYQIAALNIRATRANDAGEPSNRNESTDQAGGASAEILTYFVIPPADAQLIGLARVTDHSAGAVALAPPRIEVYARTDDSEQELVATAEIDRVANPPGIFFDVDLRPYAGESTELTFISRVADPAASDAGLAWLTLKLSGNEPLPPDPPESLHPERLNILIVLFDTLRADFTEPYGSEIVQTPWLSKLAADGVTFSNAWANSSWTTPSVASLLTGTYPGVHGMNRLLVDRLPKALPYLPQILSEAGYQTAAILNTGMVNDKPLRMGRGFDEMHELYRLRQDGSLDSIEEPEARARLVFDEYIEPMVTHESGRPWFVYLHEHDPHSPYRAPAPWNALYDFGYSRWLDTLSSNFIRAMSPTDPQRLLDEADVRHLKSRYMAEISFMDAYLGELRRQLDVQGLLERTLLLFVSDHGEAFLEHGLLGHGYSAHVEQLKIPMILSLPGVLPRGERVDSLVELVDLPPTVLQLIGVEIPSAMQGRSLLPLVFAPDSFRPERRSFGRTMNSSHRSLVRGRWHLIRAEPTGPLIGAQFELYDLESDPTEQLDRWMQREVTGRALRAMLERQDRVNQEWAKLPGGLASDGGDLLMEDLDPELRENLRDLGYLE